MLAGDRGDPQTEVGASYAPAFGEDYVELDVRRSRVELERQVRAWSLMFDRSVRGPIATLGGERVLVSEASLDDPEDPVVPRLEAADGPLWLVSVEQL